MRDAPMVKWLALPTVVLACATATAASGGAPADRNQASTVAFAGRDTDHDGLSDDAEVRRYHTDPRKRDTDRDGLDDGAEVRRYKTNPRNEDTDRDGLSDGAEVGRYHTDPRRRDTDRDGLYDGDEVRRYHTNPLERDSDGDGYGDRVEVNKGTDPRDPRSRPGFPARGQHRCAARNGAVGVHRPVDDFDAEHGDHGEDDGLYPGDGAGRRDPQLEDLVRRLLRGRERRRGLHAARRCCSRTPRSTARTGVGRRSAKPISPRAG